jgi:hypothetical protein
MTTTHSTDESARVGQGKDEVAEVTDAEQGLKDKRRFARNKRKVLEPGAQFKDASAP